MAERCSKLVMRRLGSFHRMDIGWPMKRKRAETCTSHLFPGPGAHTAVSSGGGGNARWRADGQELSGDLAVVSARGSGICKGIPSHLFREALFRLQLPWNVGDYDVYSGWQAFPGERENLVCALDCSYALARSGSGRGGKRRPRRRSAEMTHWCFVEVTSTRNNIQKLIL